MSTAGISWGVKAILMYRFTGNFGTLNLLDALALLYLSVYFILMSKDMYFNA